MHPVEHPTYLADIRFLFSEQDMQCMESRGVDLRTYEGVKVNALNIYFQVKGGEMPPQEARRWPEGQVETFYNWMRDDYPRGVAPQADYVAARSTPAERIRRNIADYTEGSTELDLLRKAFEGIMSLDTSDPDNPNGYFNLAGLHWYPPPNFCRHHENAYNPWHRAYLQVFEDALRGVEGCENVTLPYWDIASGTVPDVLQKPPFDAYTFPRDLEGPPGNVFRPAGSITERSPVSDILQELIAFDVNGDIQTALSKGRWEEFNGWWPDKPFHSGIISAHDSGHNSCGPTLTSPAWASFDPLFWFFHCNWDRLWWRWQQTYTGMNLADFKTLIVGNSDWLTDPVINGLQPFGITSPQTINLLEDMGVDYEHPPEEVIPEPEPSLVDVSRASTGGVRIIDSDRVIVTISNVNRLEIPGSFTIALTADGDILAKRGIFQPEQPKECGTCRKHGVFSVSFELERSAIDGKTLATQINLAHGTHGMREFPVVRAGNPEISVSLKMTE